MNCDDIKEIGPELDKLKILGDEFPSTVLIHVSDTGRGLIEIIHQLAQGVEYHE